MKIINLMLGRGRGGIEQAVQDYHEAMMLADIDVVSVLDKNAQMCRAFDAAGLPYETISPLGEWDIFTKRGLRALAKKHQADAMICHGNRAVSLALGAHIPVIGVAHNYKLKKRFPKCDAVFCITKDLIEECVHLNIPREKLHHIPNMTRLPAPTPRQWRTPPTIGTMGRFVEKKGMDIFIAALGALHDKGVPFKALIGGDGALAPALQAQAKSLGVTEQIEFIGWVKDKANFFAQLDIFVLPSQHEPFGIVLIEAMAAGLPVVTTDTEGPCEIITQHHDAIMVEKAKPYAMAAALGELIETPERALAMGHAARQTVADQYDLPVVSKRMKQALQRVVSSPT
jgi:glycosyltransferase involved in cell wall biosynthesis